MKTVRKPIARSRQQRISLCEDIIRMGKPDRVDAAKGVIYGVKVLGLDSLNGRRYTLEAIKRAAHLYEGCPVNVDHPDRPQQTRSAHDRFAWLEKIVVREDGMYGDLHLLETTSELSKRLLKAAQERPDVYGLSHNAIGDGKTVDGVFVVERLEEVRSVDLVAEPATTHGLFEGRPMKKTIKEILESALPKMSDRGRAKLKKLLEDDMMAPALEPEMDAPAAAEGDEDWKSHLTKAIGALTGSDDPASHDIAKKILSMLRPEEAEAPVVEDEDEDEENDKDEEQVKEGEDDEEKEKDKDKDKVESRQEAASLREELAIRDLLEESGIRFAKPEARKTFIKSLVPLSVSERKALIEERKQFTLSGNSRPRSASLHTAPDLKEAKVRDGKSIAEALLRR